MVRYWIGDARSRLKLFFDEIWSMKSGMQDRDRGSWEDGNIRAMTRSVLMSQRRSRYHAGGDEIKLEKERGDWVRVRVFEVALAG